MAILIKSQKWRDKPHELLFPPTFHQIGTFYTPFNALWIEDWSFLVPSSHFPSLIFCFLSSNTAPSSTLHHPSLSTYKHAIILMLFVISQPGTATNLKERSYHDLARWCNVGMGDDGRTNNSSILSLLTYPLFMDSHCFQTAKMPLHAFEKKLVSKKNMTIRIIFA